MALLPLRRLLAPLAVLLAAGCPSGPTILYGSAGAGGSGGPIIANGSGSTGATSSGTNSTSGGTTGIANPESPYVDGGYVFCTLPPAPDGGAVSQATWICQLGTTICDVSGAIGSCFQCRSDLDCQNPALPGFDPHRPRCDLHSGVVGYQGFCQQCLGNVDCAGNPLGPLCDLNPNYPPGALEATIDPVGFEACGALVTDCRIDGGPVCNGLNQLCDSDGGLCITRAGTCSTDQNCEGLLSSNYVPTPYCVNGICNECKGGYCPGSCVASDDCGGFWPVCEPFDAGHNGFGHPIGLCGCDDALQCGDGGLSCLPPDVTTGSQVGICGVPCTSAQFPTCASLFPSAPICEPNTGLCVGCTSNEACQDIANTGGPTCDYGQCVCVPLGNGGCPSGLTCQQELGSLVSTCNVAPPQCAHLSCSGNGFCNWDGGSCEPKGSCLADSDCDSAAPFCDSTTSPPHCLACRTSADCAKTGLAERGLSECSGGVCIQGCQSDKDCLDSRFGPVCEQYGWGSGCGCSRDLDCAGNPHGAHCDTDAGSCGCANTSECGPGLNCANFGASLGPLGECLSGCNSDVDCPGDTYCDSRRDCRPRCDDGHVCIGAQLLCDIGNVAGQNDGEDTWCYQCLRGSDCTGSEGCHEQSCGPCFESEECSPDRICVGGSCQPRCEVSPCSGGDICDRLGIGGYGLNVCLPCVTAADCPEGLGCNHDTHACGTCVAPDGQSIPPEEGFDCPAAAICSSYWEGGQTGVCLASCDLRPCPASQPRCEVIPSLNTDHRYCVGCLHDADCADAGPGAWCDVSVNATFTCQPAP